MIPKEQIDKMKEQFMGKKIRLQTEDGATWVGTCQFLGYNPYLPSWKFQVTIDRTPISHVKPNSIKLV